MIIKSYSLSIPLASLLFLSGCWHEEQGNETKALTISNAIPLEDLAKNKEEAPQVLRDHISQGKTVVDFYAKWCPPCKMMLPIIDDLSNKYEDISFIKVDIDKFNDLANSFNVAGTHIAIETVPTFYLFKDGKIVETIKGGMNKDAFELIINDSFQ